MLPRKSQSYEYNHYNTNAHNAPMLPISAPAPHFFRFRPATPPANRPRFPRLDLGLCPGPRFCAWGMPSSLDVPAGLSGRGPMFFDCACAGGPILSCCAVSGSSSPILAARWLLLAFSCVVLKRSSSSDHLTLPSSFGLSRLARSKLDALDGPEGALGVPTSELFCRK